MQSEADAPNVSSAVPPPTVTLAALLPWETITWNQFQRLIRALMAEVFPESDPREFGVPGQGQRGIDLFGRSGEGRGVYCQCKNERPFEPAKIRSAVSGFLDGGWTDPAEPERASDFILAVADDLRRTERSSAIQDVREQLVAKDVRLHVWDQHELERLLKDKPQIVFDTFGEHWAVAYCGADSLRSVSTEDDVRAVRERIRLLANPNTTFAPDRSDLVNHMVDFMNESGAVIGEPGSGKSFAIQRAAESALDAGTLVIAVRVDELNSAAQDDLRTALGFRSDESLVEYCRRLAPRFKRHVFILDGYDAARSPELLRGLRSLLKSIRADLPDWRLVVTVRRFDANRSENLEEVLPALEPSSPFPQSNDIPFRHFAIAVIEREEVRSLLAANDSTQAIAESLPDRVIDVLCTPFNLRILEQLLRQGLKPSEVGELRTEADLLRQYWERYVLAGSRPLPTTEQPLRRQALEALIGTMVSKLELHADEAVVPPEAIPALEGLVSDGIIARRIGPVPSYRFSHNSIFDFGVMTVSLGSDVESLPQFLAADQARSLWLRPSVRFYVSALWAHDRTGLLNLVLGHWNNENRPVRLAVRFVSAEVIAGALAESTDLQFFDELANRDEAACKSFARFVLVAMTTDSVRNKAVAGALLAWLAERWSLELCNEIGRAADAMSKSDDGLRAEVARSLNGTIRGVFNALAAQAANPLSNFDGFASGWLAPVVMRTFSSDPEGSAGFVKAVERSLDTENPMVQTWRSLCGGVDNVVAHNPGLAQTMFSTTVGAEISGSDNSHSTPSVMPLQFRRGDLWSLSKYVLAQYFPRLLTENSQVATDVATEGLELYINQERSYMEAQPVGPVEFQGASFTMAEDHRRFDELRHDELKGKYLHEYAEWISGDERTEAEAGFVVAALAKYSRHPAVWSFFLVNGSKQPRLYAGSVFELVSQPAVIQTLSMATAVRAAIRACAPHWSEAERAALAASLAKAEKPRDAYSDEYWQRVLTGFRQVLDGTALDEVDPPDEAYLEDIGAAEWTGESSYARPRNRARLGGRADDEAVAQSGVASMVDELDQDVKASYEAKRFGLQPPDATERAERLLARLISDPLPSDVDVDEAWHCLGRFARLLISTPEPPVEALSLASTIFRSVLTHVPGPCGELRERGDIQHQSWALIDVYSCTPWMLIATKDPFWRSVIADCLRGEDIGALEALLEYSWQLSHGSRDLFLACLAAAEATGAATVIDEAIKSISRIHPIGEEELAFLRRRIGDTGFFKGHVPHSIWAGLVVHRALVEGFSDYRTVLDEALERGMECPEMIQALTWEIATLIERSRASSPDGQPVIERVVAVLLTLIAGLETWSQETDFGDEVGQDRLKSLYVSLGTILGRAEWTMEGSDRDGESAPLTGQERDGLFKAWLPVVQRATLFEIRPGSVYLVPEDGYRVLKFAAASIQCDIQASLTVALAASKAVAPMPLLNDNMACHAAVELLREALQLDRRLIADTSLLAVFLELLEGCMESGSVEAYQFYWRLDEELRAS